jgi:hypothetical protein
MNTDAGEFAASRSRKRAPKVPSLPKEEIHRRIVSALGDDLENHGRVEEIPFRLKPRRLLRMAVYAYTVTDPPGGREADELKIQIIAPGQRKGERASFQAPDEESFLILMGYSAYYNVFVLWDAYRHQNFPHSKNCQVRLHAITDARLTGIGEHHRELRSGPETIIVARPDHLHEALARRIQVA